MQSIAFHSPPPQASKGLMTLPAPAINLQVVVSKKKGSLPVHQNRSSLPASAPAHIPPRPPLGRMPPPPLCKAPTGLIIKLCFVFIKPVSVDLILLKNETQRSANILQIREERVWKVGGDDGSEIPNHSHKHAIGFVLSLPCMVISAI